MLRTRPPPLAALTDLPDVNVWLALSAAEHPHHPRALRYWHDESDERLAFCRVTALALLRLLTNATVMDGQPLEAGEAWHIYRAWLGRGDVTAAREPDGCDAVLGGWAGNGIILPRLWTDAYLAAFARSGGMRLVTFDRDYRRFEGLDLLELES
jgi:toxin-antitoxin system PIN domain toxin